MSLSQSVNQTNAAQTASRDYDVVIVGGGLVGVSAALAMHNLGLHTAMFDSHTFGDQQQSSFNDRSIALAHGSKLILQGLGVWPDDANGLLSQSHTPIQHIHISEQRRYGRALLSARANNNGQALGHMIPSRVLGQALYQALANSDVTLFAPAKVTGFEQHQHHVNVEYTLNDQAQRCSARLMLAADGAQSAIRTQLGIDVKQHDYHQSALIFNAQMSEPHQQCAYERFTPHGPMAVLPLEGKHVAVVWTGPHALIENLLVMDDEALGQALVKQFGHRLGGVEQVSQRTHFPLHAQLAQQLGHKRVTVIGNAAHTLHPVAGQGFNLGLRDVAELQHQINRHGLDAIEAMQQTYQQQRQGDLNFTSHFTDGLVRIFSNDWPILSQSRSKALALLDAMPPLKQQLAQQSMGLNMFHTPLGRGEHGRH